MSTADPYAPPREALAAAERLVLLIAFRALQDYPRLLLLENGLLSIHSCAVMWQAVILAHNRALERISRTTGRGFEHYTTSLALEAASLRDNVFHIDEWLGY